MGLFKTTPKDKREQRLYERESAKALKSYENEQRMTRIQKLKEQARSDALPRSERARQRLSKGFSAIKLGASKLQAFDERLEARARAQGYQGGVIRQGYRQDLQGAGQRPPLLQQSMQRDQAQNSESFVEKSLRGPQGEGLIIAGLRAGVRPLPPAKVKPVYAYKRVRVR